MPLQATSGAASQDAFGGNGVAVVPTYIEDIFSCFLYTGNGSTQTITNGIDLSTKGGLVWTKSRNAGYDHELYDTARGINKVLISNSTAASANAPSSLTAFNTTGFTLGANNNSNSTGITGVSWTFRKQPKFFDVVTYTGDKASGRSIAHNLGSTPGCIIIKSFSDTEGWTVYHRSLTAVGYYLNLSATSAESNLANGISSVTSSSFTIGSNDRINSTGQTFVAYIFAHDAGGFGLTGTDNVISCGSFNYNTDPQTVTIGYEPQWLMVKRYDGVGDWIMFDNMRGFTANAGGGAGKRLLANTSGAETANDGLYYGGATGFNLNLPAYGNYIYIAIRRGPMAVPTLGTSVFSPVTYTGNGTSQSVTTGITGDLTYIKYRTDAGASTFFTDRLRGSSKILESNSTVAEDTSAQHLTSFNQLGFSVGNNGNVNASGGTFISETFKRAPSFFDEVCWITTGAAQTINHNLGVVPELMIRKVRNGTWEGWTTYSKTIGATKILYLNQTAPEDVNNAWDNTTPTSSVFYANNTLGGYNSVTYLFATCAGVSKVGSYTGTGALQTVDCGFTSGARFVLIKRTDASGDWWTYDSARGISSGNDPYLFLNSTAAEVTNTNYVDTDTTGFKVTAAAPAGLNANGGTYIFLAIA